MSHPQPPSPTQVLPPEGVPDPSSIQLPTFPPQQQAPAPQPTQVQPPAPLPPQQQPPIDMSALQAQFDQLLAKDQERDAQMRTLLEDREAREAAATAEQQRLAAEAEAERQKNLSFEERFTEYQNQTNATITGLTTQLEQRDALAQREARYQEVQDYRTRAITAKKQEILPQLLDTIRGNTEAEVDAAVSDAVERSNSILQSVAQAQGLAFQQAPGTRVTAPAVGPMDMTPGMQEVTPADIASMSDEDYAANREALHRAAGVAYRQQRFG